jgi:catechol 2,3-dioxygenase-like lactoylglutathione lyase family enzyme
MSNEEISGATFRLELFVNDIMKSIDFYRRILRFHVRDESQEGYTPMENGDVHLALNSLSNLPKSHPIRADGNERLGRGVEFLLEVDAIESVYGLVRSHN